MARRLRKKRIAVILLTFTALIGWTTHSCVSRCTSSDKEKSADSLPAVHINDSITNALTEGKAYQEMDSVIERYLKRWEINGAQLVITRNDSLLYARGFGWADKERGIRMEPNMLMRFASVSKLITAAGIMKLVEMKKLRMGDKVFGQKGILCDTTYNNSIKDQRYYNITVEQLLRHQAGFNNYAGDPVSSTRYIMMQNHLTTPPDHPTLLRILLKRHLGYTPGEGKCYSNLGYMILSMIVEKKSGMKYENFIQKYVLQPAGCFDMHIAGTYYKDRRPNETKYYMHQGSIPVYEYNNSGRMVEKCYGDTDLPRLSGAGAWCGSAAELSRFIASIDGMPHVKDILSRKSVQFMTQEQPNHQYSIGWNYTPKSNRPWIRTGSLAGTSALILKYPDGQCWILITNTSTWKFQNFIVMLRVVEERLTGNNGRVQLKSIHFSCSRNKRHSRRVDQFCIGISTLIELCEWSMSIPCDALKFVDVVLVKPVSPVAINPFFDTVDIVAKKRGQFGLRRTFPVIYNLFCCLFVNIGHLSEVVGLQQVVGIKGFSSRILRVKELEGFR